MKIIRGIKKVAKPFVDFPTWMGTSQLKNNSKDIYSAIKKNFIIAEKQQGETFEQAVQRLHLTEQDIQQRVQQFKILAISFFILALAIIIYGITLLMLRHYQGGFVAIAVACVSLTLSFRNHFWFYQVKRRKLGCSVTEWFKSFVGKA